MNMPLKLVKIGNSTGVVLPREVLVHLGADQGDILNLTEAENGIVLRVAEDDFEDQMAVARDVMSRRKRALRELAK